MYDVGVGCSLKGSSTVSTMTWWHGLHTYITWYFSQLSQILGNVCDGNGVRSVQPYAHPQQLMVLKHLILYDVGVGCSVMGSTGSSITYWHGLHTYMTWDFSQLSQICWEMSVVVTL